MKLKKFKVTKSDDKIALLVLKNSLPSILLMFFTGLYLFLDDIFSINFAGDSYEKIITAKSVTYTSTEQIRMSLAFSLNILYIVEALVLLFSIGSSVKYASLLAKGDKEKIDSFLGTSFKYMLISSIILVPILIILAKPWIKFQYGFDPFIKAEIINMSFGYLWIVIIGTPFICFAQYIAALFRARQRNILALVIIGLPLFVNILFDYLFMGVWNYNINGGAWATLISYVFSALIASIILFWKKDEYMNFGQLWRFDKIRFSWIIGILLIGSAAFVRNFSQSFTELFETHNFNNLSNKVYSVWYGNTMYEIYVNTIPIYNIMLPIMFGYIHSIAPIMSFVKEKGEYMKIRKIAFHSIIQSLIVGAILYMTIMLFMPHLTELLKINNHKSNILDKTKIVSTIMMLSIIASAPMVISITTFTGTQMYKSALALSFLRMIFFWAFIMIWNKITIMEVNTGGEPFLHYSAKGNIFTTQYTFWWYYPSLALFISLTSLIPLCLTFGRKKWCQNMEEKHKLKQAI